MNAFASDNMLSHGQEVELDAECFDVVPVVLGAGEFSLHHCLLAHGSGHNPTDQPRVGLCIKFAPGNLRQTQAEPVSAMLVRGRQTGNLLSETRPVRDLSKEAVAQHTRLLAPHAATKYVGF